jgi:catechol 2,3-dioxygenase-like lactoylglutathione lyase family enzyme
MSRIGFSHIGLCVVDVARSLRFYTGALGFEKAETYEVDDTFAPVLEVGPPVKLQSQFVRKDGVQLEFLEYVVPGHQGSDQRRPMNQLGLTHLSVTVDAIEPVVDAVVAHGGTVHRETYLDNGPGGEFIYCTDPDGIRVELMRLPG